MVTTKTCSSTSTSFRNTRKEQLGAERKGSRIAPLSSIAIVDEDGDGVVNIADPDSDGNGFVGPLDDDSGIGQGQPAELPDTNNNGVPDINQDIVGRLGAVETGLGGNRFGCSVIPPGTAGVGKRFDPLLGMLFGSSLLVLMLRRTCACIERDNVQVP